MNTSSEIPAYPSMPKAVDLEDTVPINIDEMLRKAVRKLTPEEWHQQMISFVMSTLPHDSTTTREDVVKLLEETP